ncbi:unnamed protein product [Allacma fusca]|uniref:Uncharacterized protein n=1 Tax=Allacma fusca TaxID=39272 RepID=A0A8J2KXJ2_9HEXA|nr:unnamed protein product [Allacma fusca]
MMMMSGAHTLDQLLGDGNEMGAEFKWTKRYENQTEEEKRDCLHSEKMGKQESPSSFFLMPFYLVPFRFQGTRKEN